MKLWPVEWYETDSRIQMLENLYWMLIGMLWLPTGHTILFWSIFAGFCILWLTRLFIISKLEKPKGKTT